MTSMITSSVMATVIPTTSRRAAASRRVHEFVSLTSAPCSTSIDDRGLHPTDSSDWLIQNDHAEDCNCLPTRAASNVGSASAGHLSSYPVDGSIISPSMGLPFDHPSVVSSDEDELFRTTGLDAPFDGYAAAVRGNRLASLSSLSHSGAGVNSARASVEINATLGLSASSLSAAIKRGTAVSPVSTTSAGTTTTYTPLSVIDSFYAYASDTVSSSDNNSPSPKPKVIPQRSGSKRHFFRRIFSKQSLAESTTTAVTISSSPAEKWS